MYINTGLTGSSAHLARDIILWRLQYCYPVVQIRSLKRIIPRRQTVSELELSFHILVGHLMVTDSPMTIEKLVNVLPDQLSEDMAGWQHPGGTQLVSFQLTVLSQLLNQRYPNSCSSITTYRLLQKVMCNVYQRNQDSNTSVRVLEDLRKWYIDKQVKQVRKHRHITIVICCH